MEGEVVVKGIEKQKTTQICDIDKRLYQAKDLDQIVNVTMF